MKRIVAILVLSSLFAAGYVPGRGQQSSPGGGRPTVGLVLSGGGARGFGHIGVLRVLEANRVPVDYVGGASMGALIGGLYAMGHTPDEIEAIVTNLDWDRLFQPTASFENLSFRRKEDRRNIPAPVTLKGKINDLKLPNALNSGHEIGLLIDRLTLPYATVTDFSRLPIPFQAVGTDMVKGVSVALDSGSLSRSLRASMSVPGVFAPVEVDGKILADGGLVNNIPTDVVKAMGADIVLVVNIETQLGGRESLESLPGILAQTINIAAVDNSRRSLRQADLIISPDLAPYTSSDFGSAKEIIKLGYNGALEKAALLRPLSLGEAEWAAHLAARRARMRPDTPPVPDVVTVNVDDPDSSRLIAEQLDGKYAGRPLDREQQDQLARDLSRLTGTGRFEALHYRLAEKDGKTELVIGSNRVGGETSRPTRLELGLDVNSVESDNVNFNFLARLTLFDVGKRGAEWRNDLRLGSNGFLGSEYYYPVGRTGFFVAPRGSYERRRINFFTDQNRIAEYVGQQAQLAFDAGYTFSSRNELRVGYTLGYQSLSRRIGDPLLPDISGGFSSVGVRWAYDSLDRAQVPTTGVLARTSLNYFIDSPGSTEPVAQGETRVTAFRPWRERNVLIGFGGAGTTFSSTAATLQQFTLGGPFRIGGYGFEELRGSNYLHAGGGILHNPELIPSFLGGKTYIGAWYEGGSMFERLGNANYRQSLSGGAIFETPVGPVFIGGSVNENGRGRFYFSFGRVFK